jgi:hypothetical protein
MAFMGATKIQMSDCRGSVGVKAMKIAGGHSSNPLIADVSRPVATYVPVRKPAIADASVHHTFLATMTNKD